MVLGLPLLLPADRIVGRVLLEIVKPCVIVSTSIVGFLAGGGREQVKAEEGRHTLCCTMRNLVLEAALPSHEENESVVDWRSRRGCKAGIRTDSGEYYRHRCSLSFGPRVPWQDADRKHCEDELCRTSAFGALHCVTHGKL